MHKLNAIRSSVMQSEMKDDSLVPTSRPSSDQLTPEMVPAHVLKAVYSKRIRRNGMGICDLFCCGCCQKRRKASSYVPMSGVADDELSVFSGDPGVPLVNSPRTVKRDTRGAARVSRRKEREGESKKSARLRL